MTKKTDHFYVTTPIYYVTARPHLGTLYSTILADVVARWQKIQGKKVFFLTGTDEHGQKVAQAAEKAGKSPMEFVNSFISAYKDVWEKYNIEYSHFIRTTDDYHVKAVQDWIQKLQKKGDIYKGTYDGWYCVHCELFVTEKDIGDSGEEPLCPDCKRPTIKSSEETYFFKLSAYQDKLLKFYEEHANFSVPKERLNEVISFVKSGLKDLSLSRKKISWGIPFPDDPEHVVYVWADALNNYITGIGYGQPGREKEFAQWWPADVHIMGKDIVRFHAIYWPAFLMATGLDLPKHLLVHGWITVDKQKMSKSFGNIVDPQALYDAYGADVVRYYLVRQLAVSQDGDFSTGDLEQRLASELANDLGNLLNRTLVLAEKNGVTKLECRELNCVKEMHLKTECTKTLQEYAEIMNGYSFHMAVARLWKFINQVNAYFHMQEPWKLATTDKAGFEKVLSATCHSLRAIAVLLWPVMPNKMEQLLGALGVAVDMHKTNLQELKLGEWSQQFTLKKIPALFTVPEKKEEPKKGTSVEQKTEEKTYITIDDVIKVELVVGAIEQCEEVPKSDKLYAMRVNFGEKGMRQILAGIKKHYKVEDLVGKQGIFIFNLKPRKMAGLESQGMMLIAEAEDGLLQMATVAGKVPNGTRLR